MYVSVDSLTQYALERNIKLPEKEAEVKALLVRAVDFIELKSFIGKKLSTEQSYEWPRSFVLNGVEYTGTPENIKKAVYETAIAASKGFDLMPIVNNQSFIKSEKVGELQVTYDTDYMKSKGGTPTLSVVETLLKPYLSENGFNSFTLFTQRV